MSFTDERRGSRPRPWYLPTNLSCYGITKEEYLAMIRRQKGKCAICGCSLMGFNSRAIDHCHDTGKVRGVLCRKCNIGLGGFQDSIGALVEAANYLIRSRARSEDYKAGVSLA